MTNFISFDSPERGQQHIKASRCQNDFLRKFLGMKKTVSRNSAKYQFV